ncbi:hypothetical protein HanIR_Chr11g0538601 [Helianthus annuus]|nr:hypothetical protein HanIR_Chr11g0538601 [Helianthus annuus]
MFTLHCKSKPQLAILNSISHYEPVLLQQTRNLLRTCKSSLKGMTTCTSTRSKRNERPPTTLVQAPTLSPPVQAPYLDETDQIRWRWFAGCKGRPTGDGVGGGGRILSVCTRERMVERVVERKSGIRAGSTFMEA